MDLFDLSGRTALITGGSRGIGRAIADTLAAAGADIIVVSRDQAGCDRAAGEIADATGVRTFAHACHIGRVGTSSIGSPTRRGTTPARWTYSSTTLGCPRSTTTSRP